MVRVDPLETLRANLGASYSPDSVRTFMGQAGRFLAWAKASGVAGVNGYSREELLRYVEHLTVQRGQKPASVQTALSALRSLAAANGWAWPLGKRDIHLSDPDEGGPALDPADVGKLIAGARHAGSPAVQVVAISTTWGLRAVEIETVLGAGMDGAVLDIQTGKGGHRRRHQVPTALAEYLTFAPMALGRRALHDLYRRLMREHVRPPRAGEGWHAIRRSLVTGLVGAGVPEPTVYRFMGWRISHTPYRYHRPPSLDPTIYRAHPFLPFWINNALF